MGPSTGRRAGLGSRSGRNRGRGSRPPRESGWIAKFVAGVRKPVIFKKACDSAAGVTLQGTYTAIVTPTLGRGEVDESAFRSLLDWQAASGVEGVVVGGTTGESPTLTERELGHLFETAMDQLPSKVEVIAATGRSHMSGTLALTEVASDLGIRTILLVDPYYNGPSSLEIRRESIEPIAERFPSIGIVPYVIPGRTGTRLDPVDVERLVADHRLVTGLKDATADDAYARELRARCPELPILCGDDARTLRMMGDPEIRASGVISVTSNLVPSEVVALVRAGRNGDFSEAARRAALLEPLFDTVTIRSTESGPDGESVTVRSRNPVPVKTALAVLGVSVGACRAPLGRLGPNGLRMVIDALEGVRKINAGAFHALEATFHVDVQKRLADPSLHRELAYDHW
jgi:4-hydroxy-tetrahydrodipicolinate synthase